VQPKAAAEKGAHAVTPAVGGAKRGRSSPKKAPPRSVMTPGCAISVCPEDDEGACQVVMASGLKKQSPGVGDEVLVLGDGWGGGGKSYPAAVLEADDHGFTVVMLQGAPAPGCKAHVLRRYCISRGAASAPAWLGGPSGGTQSKGIGAAPGRPVGMQAQSTLGSQLYMVGEDVN